MDRQAIEQEREELLNKMAEDLQEGLIAATVREPEEEGDVPVLSVLFDEFGEGEDEAYGEFFFRPIISDEDQVQFFSGVITLSDSLPEEHLKELFEAMSYINFQLPCGCFALDKTKTLLIFRECIPLPMNLTGDALYEQMNIISGNAAASADAYISTLLQVAEGELSVEDVIELLNVPEEEQETNEQN